MSQINTMPIPLYHGTDKKILDYSEEERIEIQAICVVISDYSYRLLSEDGLSISSFSEYRTKRLAEIGVNWPHIIDSFQKYDSRKKGSNLYQYGALYLSGDKEKAKVYARDSFIMGEQGKVAYWLYVAVSNIWNLEECSPDMKYLFKRFEELMAKPHIPVILTFNSVMRGDL